MQEPSMYTIRAMCILDHDGRRVLAHYYDKASFPSLKDQTTFETKLFSKTKKGNSEIVVVDGHTCLFKSNVDLFFYVIGSPFENEVSIIHNRLLFYRNTFNVVETPMAQLILLSVLNCLYDTVSMILRRNVDKSAVYDNMEVIMLGLDEICDDGIILETDANTILGRVAIRTEDVPLAEQTVSQVLQSAKEQIKWSLLK